MYLYSSHLLLFKSQIENAVHSELFTWDFQVLSENNQEGIILVLIIVLNEKKRRSSLLIVIWGILNDKVVVCSGLTSLSLLSVISRRCLVVTGSSMLTFIVLPHCGI